MVRLTLIRHGESRSNLNRSGYSGWKDSPLTELGERQADELGKSFKDTSTHFTHLYSSDLIRAQATALAILKHQTTPPIPSLITTPKIREIGFGIAEGHPYTPGDYPPLIKGEKTLEELYQEGVFPDFQARGRDAKFPEGESLNEVEGRVGEVIREVVLPLVFETRKRSSRSKLEEEEDYHVGFVSHGLCLFEMVNALLRLDPEKKVLEKYRGHYNTGWSRFEISVKDKREGGEEYDVNSPPPLEVRLVTFDSHGHLASLPAPSNPGYGVVV